jgi:hypothetical protein
MQACKIGLRQEMATGIFMGLIARLKMPMTVFMTFKKGAAL